MPRQLVAVTAEMPVFTGILSRALNGTGPAALPLPGEPVAADRLRLAMRPDEPLENDETAIVIATSGSTGAPKGVLISAAALLASAAATHQRLGGPGRWLLALPTTHIAGIQVVVRSLTTGSEPELLPAAGLTAAGFIASTRALGSDRRYTALVPTQLRRLLSCGPEVIQALASYDAVLLGGAAATSALLADARGAGVRVVTTYGMSETSGGCVYDGSPLSGVGVRLNPAGRIELSGPVLARGYRLQPDLTARHFRDGWFTTDDTGSHDATGRLALVGRIDDMVVTGGEKVPPAAVEAALAEHPAVADVAVVGAADVEWGQRVVAFVVLRPGAALTLEQTRQHVADRVSRVAAPRELRILDELPLLASGKIDRRAL